MPAVIRSGGCAHDHTSHHHGHVQPARKIPATRQSFRPPRIHCRGAAYRADGYHTPTHPAGSTGSAGWTVQCAAKSGTASGNQEDSRKQSRWPPAGLGADCNPTTPDPLSAPAMSQLAAAGWSPAAKVRSGTARWPLPIKRKQRKPAASGFGEGSTPGCARPPAESALSPGCFPKRHSAAPGYCHGYQLYLVSRGTSIHTLIVAVAVPPHMIMGSQFSSSIFDGRRGVTLARAISSGNRKPSRQRLLFYRIGVVQPRTPAAARDIKDHGGAGTTPRGGKPRPQTAQ